MSKTAAIFYVIGAMLLETVIIAVPVAALFFWLCYLGDIVWGQHLMVTVTDRCFIVCAAIGIIAGLVCAISSTMKAAADIRGNHKVK